MAEIFTNTFEKGMNMDLSRSVFNKSQYPKAKNFRLVTEAGKTEYSIENIKGNAQTYTILPCSEVHTITFTTEDILPGPLVVDFNITMGSTFVTDIWTTNNLGQYPIQEIYKKFSDFINGADAYASTVYTSAGFRAATKGESVVIWRVQPFTGTGSIVFGGTLQSIGWFNSTLMVPFILNPILIGCGTIRDSKVLFTADSSLDADEPSLLGSYGQLWKLDIDGVTLSPTLTLSYNGALNMTSAHPIPTIDGSQGRHEFEELQNIYWTDNFNPPRKLNVVDANAFAINPENLELLSPARFTEPIFTEIVYPGEVKTGIHNIAYKLSTIEGAETIYSPLSNNIHLNTANNNNELTQPYNLYRESPPGASSGKSLKIKISNIDTDYDRIDIIDIFRASTTAPPEITRVSSEPIPSTGEYTFIYTGLEEGVEDVSLEEYNIQTLKFKTVKSLASKNNMLFASNVTTSKFSVDFDARAYRWQRTDVAPFPSVTEVLDSAGNITTVNPLLPQWDVAETHDAINPDQSPEYDSYIYRRGVDTFGGDGPNISYTFENDNGKINLLTSRNEPDTGGYVNVDRETFTFDINHEEDYTNNNLWKNHKSPYISGLLKGYQRDETYRFGIVFYSLDGVPSDVKWIADIRMPHINMPERQPSPNKTVRFPVSSWSGAPDEEVYGHNLAVRFNVDISSVQDQISGFSIVRVPRLSKDRTILGQGMLWRAWNNYNNTTAYPNLNDIRLVPNEIGESYDGAQWLIPSDHYCSLNAPDFLFAGMPSRRINDSIDILNRQNAVASQIIRSGLNAPIDGPDNELRLYYFTQTTGDVPGMVNEHEVQESRFFGNMYQDHGPHILAGNVVYNKSPEWYDNSTDNGQRSVGGGTLAMKIFPDFLTLGGLGGEKFIANYKRVVLKQYGGNTFSERSLNEYIYCGHFQPVDSTISPSLSDIDVFGGDIFVCMFDNIKGFRNWNPEGGTGQGVKPNGSPVEDFGNMTAVAFPVECSHNIDWRGGTWVLNRSYLVTNGAGIDTTEDFVINNLWSVDNDIKKYYVKPTDVRDIDVYDHRTYNSQPKIDGELHDSWTSFSVNNYQDVNSSHGPINFTCVLNDKFYFLQDRAIGTEAINERTAVQDTTGVFLQLGSSDILSRYDYISTDIGTKHQWSVYPDMSGLYFYASTLNRIYKLNNEGLEPISMTAGIQSHLKNNYSSLVDSDNPIIGNGVIVGSNPKYNEILFTFNKNGGPSDTLCYNTKVEQFTGFYSFIPKIYINFNNELITHPVLASGADVAWLHDVGAYNSFYGTVGPSELTLLINPSPATTKIFDNFSFHTLMRNFANTADIPNETFNTIRSYTDYQDSGVTALVPDTNIKRKERTWQLSAGRDSITASPRLRDKYLLIDLVYNNVNNRKLILYYLNTYFRPSYR